MNIRFLLTVLISCLPVAAIFADQTDEVKKQINKIKKNTQYIYAESTAPTEADAQNYAEEKLYDEINKWVATQKKMKNSPNLVVNNKKSLWTTLSMPRGTNMFRSFIYVKKSDIIPTDNATIISNENLTVEKTLAPVLPEAVNAIAACTEYADMAAKIKELKAEGKIKSYARYASLNKPEDYYLAIYNRDGKVVAVLTPGTERRNVKTNKPDSVKNYGGCGAIGFNL